MRLQSLLLAMLLGAAQAAAWAGEVIAHPGVRLDAEEVRDVYLGERLFFNGVKLVPVDNSTAQRQFLGMVLQTDVRTYSARWTKKSFREGLAAPVVMGSDAEVAAFVRSTPGAVGYVSGTASGVTVLLRY